MFSRRRGIRIALLLMIVLVFVSACSSGPPDEETSRVISADIGWSSYDAIVTVVGKERCGAKSGDQASGITQRWLVVYRIENYMNPESEYTKILIEKNGVWQVEHRGVFDSSPRCP